MGHVVATEKWIEAVLRHAPTTRHLHITVKAIEGSIRLEGRVPTLEDRARAGFLARSVSPPGLGLDNRLVVEDDMVLTIHASRPRSQGKSRQSARAVAA